MQKNKTLIIAFIYSLLFSAAVCVVFYGDHVKYITHVYLIGLLCMFPFLFTAVYFERKDNFDNEIGGRAASKLGLKFVVMATLFLMLFQTVFFTVSFKDYKINYMQSVGPQMLKEQIASGNLKITEAEIPKVIATDVEGVTLFKEITSVIFKTVFYGAFCSIITAFTLKRKHD